MTTTCISPTTPGMLRHEGAKSQRGRAKRLLVFGLTRTVFRLASVRLYTTGERPPSTLVAVPVM